MAFSVPSICVPHINVRLKTHGYGVGLIGAGLKPMHARGWDSPYDKAGSSGNVWHED